MLRMNDNSDISKQSSAPLQKIFLGELLSSM